MIRSKKIATTALVSAVVTGGLLVGSSTSAQADGEGNRVIVSGYGYENVRSRCFDQQRAYSSMRVRITQSCTYIGMTQRGEYGFAFWWTTA